MVESFVAKSGALYTTVTNLLTIADMNFKERLSRALQNWQGRYTLWQQEQR